MLLSSISVCQHIATDVRSATCGIAEHSYLSGQHLPNEHRTQNTVATEHNYTIGQQVPSYTDPVHQVPTIRVARAQSRSFIVRTL